MLERLHKALGLGLALAADRNGETDRDDVLEVGRRWRTALAEQDLGTLESILADEFVMVWVDGSLLRKSDVLAGTAARKAQVGPVTADEAQVRLYGSTAVVTSRSSWAISVDRKAETTSFISTVVYSRFTSGWRAVGAQTSIVRPGQRRSEDFDDDERDVVGSATRQDHFEERVGRNVERVDGQLIEQFFFRNEAR